MSDKHDMYLEFARVGSAFEVRAVDATDGLEVSFTAPVNAPQHELERLAWQKLAWVRRKIEVAERSTNTSRQSNSRRGIIV